VATKVATKVDGGGGGHFCGPLFSMTGLTFVRCCLSRTPSCHAKQHQVLWQSTRWLCLQHGWTLDDSMHRQ